MPNPHSQPEGASGRTEAISAKVWELAHIADTNGEFSIDTRLAVEEVMEAVRAPVAALQQAVADAQKDNTDAERWRFVLPLLGDLLRSQYWEDVKGPEMYLELGDMKLRTGSQGNYTRVLVTLAVDRARIPDPVTPTERPTDG